MEKIKCSIAILTFNSAKTLDKCLNSVKDFEEIIICDGGSTDETLSIARKHGCVVIPQDSIFKNKDGSIKDFAGVRNQTLDISRYKWFFFIDSDEYISSELAQEIRSITDNPLAEMAAYWVPRKYVYKGDVIDCATTYPNKQMRFFHKNVVMRFIKEVHERIDVNKNARIMELKNVILVPIEENIDILRKKWNRYIEIEAGRAGEITFAGFIKSFLENLKISFLYFLRFFKIILFCKGKKMPFIYELERHVYHINTLRAFWNKRKSENNSVIIERIRNNMFIVVVLAIVLFFSTYHLAESPPVWMDEGIITQVSQNIANHTVNGIQIAPGEFISAGFVTTGYSITYPVAISFKIFGNGILQARIVMVLYILLFFVFAYLLAKKEMSKMWVFYAMFLLASFAPIYGNGKNVLGEVPGLLFLLLTLFFIRNIENKKNKTFSIIFAGFFAGLCLITKPIFFLLLPSIFLPFCFYRKKIPIKLKNIIFFIIAFSFPFFAWIFFQFQGDSFLKILSIYANPHNTSLWISIFENSKRFFTEMQPMYFFFILIVWIVSFFIRLRKKIDISFSESIAFSFSFFIFIAYLRTIGYYRYFFLGQVVALLYLPLAISSISFKKIYRIIIIILLFLMILFQFYQTVFHSWMANYYNSTRTEQLQKYFKNKDNKETFFIYQVPEVALFLPNTNYFQYLEVTSSIIAGANQLDKIKNGIPNEIIILSDLYDKNNILFSAYGLKTNINRYSILEKIN